MPPVSLKGLLLWTVLISTVYFGSHTFLLPPVFLVFVSLRAYRRFVDAAISTWNWLIVVRLHDVIRNEDICYPFCVEVDIVLLTTGPPG